MAARAPKKKAAVPDGLVLGIGLDVAAVDRIAHAMIGERGELFLERVFTRREREFCDRRADRADAYAARFAAKEAFVKALGVPKGISWQHIEVVRDGGAPELLLTGKAEEVMRERGARALLTLSHDAGVAVAVVVLVTGKP